MNIVIITTHYPTPDPGCKLSPADHYYAREWIRQGHNVLVFHISASLLRGSNCGIFHQYYIENVKVYQSNNLRLIPRQNITEYFTTKRIAQKILEILTQEMQRVDLFYCDFCSGNWDVISIIKKTSEYKDSLYVPVFNNCDFYNIQRAKKIIKSSLIVAVRSKEQRNRIKEMFPQSDPIIMYSGAPLPLETSHSIGCSENADEHLTYTIMYAGDLIPLKNVDILLKSFSELAKDLPVKCVIVGDGPMENELRALTSSLNIESKVLFTGRLSRQDVLRHMSKSDVFVMASSPESFGIVYLEAMSEGCFVIACRNEGIDGVVKNGVNGALVHARNVEELTDAIRAFYSATPLQRKNWQNESVITANEYSEYNVAKKAIEDIIRANRRQQ